MYISLGSSRRALSNGYTLGSATRPWGRGLATNLKKCLKIDKTAVCMYEVCMCVCFGGVLDALSNEHKTGIIG